MAQNQHNELVRDYKLVTELCRFCNDIFDANVRNYEYEGLGRVPTKEEVISLIGATCNRPENRKRIIKISKNGNGRIPTLSKVFVKQMGTVDMVEVLNSYSDENQGTRDIAGLLRTQIYIPETAD